MEISKIMVMATRGTMVIIIRKMMVMVTKGTMATTIGREEIKGNAHIINLVTRVTMTVTNMNPEEVLSLHIIGMKY